MITRDRSEAFQIYLAILAKGLEDTRPKGHDLTDREGLKNYAKSCARFAIYMQNNFDQEWSLVTEVTEATEGK
jgi:hypothetical protein